jgi:hypothetical protein
MTELLWYCPQCGSGNERMEAIKGKRRYWLFGARRTQLIAICIDCWNQMEFVGTV